MNNHGETIIDLLRHGEPHGGNMVFRGRTDDPLTTDGWQQMASTIGKHKPWDNIITSPALRCAEYAKKLATSLSIPVHENDQLWEMDFGEWDGRTFSDIQKTEANLLKQFWQDPVNVTPPCGEPLMQFQQRILQAWNSLQQNNQNKHLLLIAHGGSLRVIIGHVLGIPLNSLLKLEIPYAAISRIRVYTDDSQTSSTLVFHAGAL